MIKSLLVLAALLGLVGETVATAAVPVTMSPTVVSSMTEDCMEMMADEEDTQPQPCDGSFKCMLAMGCLSVNVIAEAGIDPAQNFVPSTPEYWSVVAILRGASFAPEPDPPTTFG